MGRAGECARREESAVAYQPIENYGMIGDLHTVALVGLDGSIDWFCVPHFDSPSVFAALLDDTKGGRFRVSPIDGDVTYRQFYWPETNVLITRFLSEDGVGEIADYMPVGDQKESHASHRLVRRVTGIRGAMRFRMECSPAFNYARDDHTTLVSDAGAVFISPNLQLGLHSTTPLTKEGTGVVAEFVLDEGESVEFTVAEQRCQCRDPQCLSPENQEDIFSSTVAYWHNWIGKCTYTGRWREEVRRAALALKLLTFAPTGAIVAAPTTSLPEEIGGERNWDYRYTWIRDAAFSMFALIRLGFIDEAADFMSWIEDRCRDLNPDGSLQLVYGLDGRHELPEETLDHLEGYRGSGPVRIGNDAHGQLQLDIYGELIDSVYIFDRYGAPISYDFWTHVRQLVDWVCDNWHREDESIWEVRGGRRHFVYSKLMCWVALDRALRLSDARSFPADRARWSGVRDQRLEDIMENGWDQDRRAFMQSYGSSALDALVLMMPIMRLVSPTDPRMVSTLDAINRSPRNEGLVSNGLVYRYNPDSALDGLNGEEGTFNICTFWLVDAKTRAGLLDSKQRYRLDEARLDFQQMLTYANHLGLYSEETGPRGEALGNFPQAFTLLGLIASAYNLDRALGAETPPPAPG
jgi:GH15 family glucan-1,4-alpha-glucosidase